MSNQATRPDYFAGIKSTLTSEGELKEKGIDLEDNDLAAMSVHRGWKVLREYIDNMVSDLDNITKAQMQEGKSFEEIGQNAIVTQLAKEFLTKIIHKVDDAKEAVEREEAKVRAKAGDKSGK